MTEQLGIHDIIEQHAEHHAKLQALQARAQMAVDADPQNYRYLRHIVGLRRTVVSKNIKAVFIRLFFTLGMFAVVGAIVLWMRDILNLKYSAEFGPIAMIGLIIWGLWSYYVWFQLRLYGKKAIYSDPDSDFV